jgi:hypothetical protein
MSILNLFSVIAGTASILSLVISIIVLKKVNHLTITNLDNSQSNSEILVEGNRNITSGRDKN